MAKINSTGIRITQYYWGCGVVLPIMSREALIDSGLAQEYMFDQLGNQNSRVGGTEYGDQFNLKRLKSGRYRFSLWLKKEAQAPFALRAVDPYATDISDILAQLGVSS